LKFCSSRGPTVSGDDVLVVGVLVVGCAVLCANARDGPSKSPAANSATVKRRTALIVSRMPWIAPSRGALLAHAQQSAALQAQAR
jgi:hypothetical protein